MLSRYGVGHCRAAVFHELYKGIEAAGIHFCLQQYAAFGDIVGIHMNNTDMFAVNGSMEEVQLVSVIKKIRT